MKTKPINFAIIPVLFGFFVMGFVDLVGISTNYVKQDFGLSDSLAGLLPMMVFLWFAVVSLPSSLLMNAIGRKKTVLLSLALTMVALFLPSFAYSFPIMLIAFALLGIGNTIIQVSLNPLLTNIVSGDRLTSTLTLGQFIKAMSSFLGPIIAGYASAVWGNWKLSFLLFALLSALSGIWLLLTPIKEEETAAANSSIGQIFGLLKRTKIRLLFLGILVLVGIDVGLNVYIPKILMERAHLPLEQAGLGTSIYFAARTIGTFFGAILLVKMASRKFYIYSLFLGIAAAIALFFISDLWLLRLLIFLLGLSLANVFSIIFAAALRQEPQRANEVSGLLIMGVAGGAVLPPIMGLISDGVGLAGTIAVVLFSLLFLLYAAVKMEK